MKPVSRAAARPKLLDVTALPATPRYSTLGLDKTVQKRAARAYTQERYREAGRRKADRSTACAREKPIV